ncbi:MAG: histidine kinase [Bacteroidia bacterium]|nr:histidine kinase [Bacteroidia bacterium]
MLKNQLTYSIKQFLLVYLAWWLAWAFIQTLVLHRMLLAWQPAIIDAVVTNTFLALACLSTILLYRYYQPGAGNRLYRLLFAICITVLFCNAIKWVLIYVFAQNTVYLTFLENSMPLRFVFSFLMVSFVSVLNWLWNSLQEQNNQIKRKNEAEQMVKEAELAKLRQQLQPHFLFNSLNSISALAGSRPDEARRMIQQLSDFLRGTLKKDEQNTVSLSEELNHLKLYLEIEKVRFGERLEVDLQVQEGSSAALIPPLLLQPIVENAIKFGLYGTTDNVKVLIIVELQKANLKIEIRNPFDPELQSRQGGTGFGLSSVQRRLYLLYSRNDLLHTEKEEKTFITQLKIPQAK